MIKVDRKKTKLKGYDAELLAEFTMIVFAMKEVLSPDAKEVFEKTLGMLQNCDNEDEFQRLLLEETLKNLCKKEEEE